MVPGTDGTWLDVHHRAKLPVRRKMIEDLDVPAAARILDVGCGSGGFGELLMEQLAPAMYVGFDSEPSHVVKTRQRLREAASAVFVIGDLSALPLVGGFDLVWCANTLSYAQRPSEVMVSLVGVLNNSGILALKDEDSARDIFLSWDPGLERAVADAWYDICLERFDGEWDAFCGRRLYGLALRAGLSSVRAKTYVFEHFGRPNRHMVQYLQAAFSKYDTQYRARLTVSRYEQLMASLDSGSPDCIFERDDFHFIGTETLVTGLA